MTQKQMLMLEMTSGCPHDGAVEDWSDIWKWRCGLCGEFFEQELTGLE